MDPPLANHLDCFFKMQLIGRPLEFLLGSCFTSDFLSLQRFYSLLPCVNSVVRRSGVLSQGGPVTTSGHSINDESRIADAGMLKSYDQVMKKDSVFCTSITIDVETVQTSL